MSQVEPEKIKPLSAANANNSNLVISSWVHGVACPRLCMVHVNVFSSVLSTLLLCGDNSLPPSFR